MNLKDKKQVQEIWEKLDKKLSVVAKRRYGCMPHASKDGEYISSHERIGVWTQGFYPGMMWLMWDATKNDVYKKTAEKTEEQLDKAFETAYKQGHDVGFVWHLSAGANYRLTGNEKSKNRDMMAAIILASRFNPAGNYIRAWDSTCGFAENNELSKGWVIIDCMMNLPLLYWASEQTGDDRFKTIAMRHADKVIQNHIRPDGSVRHIVEYNPENGEFVKDYSGQGAYHGSSWSRGQSWALYGLTLSYIHTKEQRYLDAAKRVSHYFISASCEDWLVKCDFRQPDEPKYYDSSAAMCAACGLLELSKIVPDGEKSLYYNAAIHLIEATTEKWADFSPETDNILTGYTEMYYSYYKQYNCPIIYADFYYVEAINKLMGFNTFLW